MKEHKNKTHLLKTFLGLFCGANLLSSGEERLMMQGYDKKRRAHKRKLTSKED